MHTTIPIYSYLSLFFPRNSIENRVTGEKSCFSPVTRKKKELRGKNIALHGNYLYNCINWIRQSARDLYD